MAVNSSSSPTQKNNPLIIAGLIAIIAIGVFLAFKLSPHREVMTLPDTPGITFMKQKAQECKGDYSKLSPEDQAKVEEYSNRHGAMSIAMYYHPGQ